MNNESFCLPGDWTCGCMDNMSDSEANFLFFGNDDGFVSTAKRPNGRNVKVWVHFKGGVPVIRLQWKGGWSEYRPAIDGNGLIKITYDRYFDEKKESRSNIKDALFHVPNSNDLWNRVKTAMDEYVLYKNNMKTNENRKMNKKNTIRMNESQLKKVVAGVVKNVLNEYYDKERWSQAEGGYIPNDDEEDFGTAYDAKGKEIHEGDIVVWIDPETGRKTKYKVYDTPTEDMVKLHNKHGECEALPEECIVIK